MPVYLYLNEGTNQIVEVFQQMNEKHEYSENGIKYKRIFTKPCANMDTKIDAFSEKQFIEKTANKKGTYGEALDYSREMSEKRKQLNGGIDPIREKFYKRYEKTHAGLIHPEKKKEENSKKLKEMGISVSLK